MTSANETKFGKDYCSTCGYLKPIVHEGKSGKKIIKLCGECFGLVQGGQEMLDSLFKPEAPLLSPQEKFALQLHKSFMVGLVLGIALTTAAIVILLEILLMVPG